MNITLSALTDPVSPTTPRSAAQVLFDNDYFKLTVLPDKQKLAIAVLGMIHAISATTNYIAAHKQMREDAKVLLGGISKPMDFWAGMAAWVWTQGVAADVSQGHAGAYGTATYPMQSDVNGLLAESKHLLEYSEEELIKCLLFTLLTKN